MVTCSGRMPRITSKLPEAGAFSVASSRGKTSFPIMPSATMLEASAVPEALTKLMLGFPMKSAV